MTSRWGMVTVLVMLLAAVLVFEPAGAVQRWSPMQVSRDGRAWSSSLTQPLFAAPVVLVPGEQRVASFQVRNSSTDVAGLMMHFAVGRDRGWWARTAKASPDQVRLYLRTGRGAWRQIVSADWLTPVLTVRPGAQQRFQVRLLLPRGASNAARRRSMRFAIKLQLTQASKGA